METDNILLFLVALLMAANQGIKDAPALRERFPSLNFPSWVNYVPLVLFLAWAMVHFTPVAKVVQGKVKSLPPPVVEGIPIEGIEQASEGKTTAQIENVQKPFRTLKATITGSVDDVNASKGSFALVYLGGVINGREVKLLFPNWDQRIEGLRIGSRVHAECSFASLSIGSINFNECRLLAAAAASPAS